MKASPFIFPSLGFFTKSPSRTWRTLHQRLAQQDQYGQTLGEHCYRYDKANPPHSQFPSCESTPEWPAERRSTCFFQFHPEELRREVQSRGSRGRSAFQGSEAS